jgi:hypothetical protein
MVPAKGPQGNRYEGRKFCPQSKNFRWQKIFVG